MQYDLLLGAAKEIPMSIMVKISLVVYGLLSLFSIALLWRNASAPDALKNAGIVVASIIPVSLAVFTYLISEKFSKTLNFMILYDNETKQITGNGPYGLVYGKYLPKQKIDIPGSSTLFGKMGLDLVEYMILQNLMVRFQIHWDYATTSTLKTPDMGGSQFKLDLKKAKSDFNLESLKKSFKSNLFVDSLSGFNLALPPGSTLKSVTENDHERKLILGNVEFPIEIKIITSMTTVVQQSMVGIVDVPKNSPNRFEAIYFTVSISGKTSSFQTYSEQMLAYKRWFANIGENLSELDISRINDNITERLMRDAAIKVLSQ